MTLHPGQPTARARRPSRVALSRLAGLLILSAVGQVVVMFLLAAHFYPGGDYWDARTAGYSFWRNTFCDLGMATAHNGRANPTWSVAFGLSMIVLFLAFGPLWLGLPRLFPRARRIGFAVAGLGLMSVVGGVLVPVFPAGQAGHGVAIGFSAVPGLAALILAIIGLAVARAWRMAAFSAGLLVVGLAHFTQYVQAFWLDRPWTPAAPAMAKVAAMYALAWMATIAMILWRNCAGDAHE
jgi:hypothetical protein